MLIVNHNEIGNTDKDKAQLLSLAQNQ